MTVAVHVSSVPGSVNEPEREKAEPSSAEPVAVPASTLGATLLTLTVLLSLSEPVSSSVMVQLTG